MSPSNLPPTSSKKLGGAIALIIIILLLIVIIIIPNYFSTSSGIITALGLIIGLLGVFFSFLQTFPKISEQIANIFSLRPSFNFAKNRFLLILSSIVIIVLLALNAFQAYVIVNQSKAESTQKSGVRATPSSITAPTTPPTPSPTMTRGVNSQFAYDFEDGTTQGWDTSEGQKKLASLQVVPDPIEKGNHVLQVMTTLTGGANNEVYRHTDAKVYFTQKTPNGFSTSPPYNFQGKQVSCQVYLPQGLTTGSPLPTVNIAVKDASQRNDNGKPIPVDVSIVGKWIQLSFVVGKYQEDADQGFDGTHIISVGVQVVVQPGSTLNYTGPFYIDNCVLPH